jgi:hypothetical protein
MTGPKHKNKEGRRIGEEKGEKTRGEGQEEDRVT